MTISLCALSGLLAVGTLGPGEALARRGEADGGSPGERALREGTQALAAGDLATAGKRLNESYRREPSPEALYQLGVLALREGRELDAHDLMRRFLADPNLEATTDPAALAEAQRVLATPRPASGQLSVLGARGTLVSVDGRLVGALPLPRPVLLSPSEHTVLLERGRQRLEDQIQVPAARLGELRANETTGALLLVVLPGVVILDELTGLAAKTTRLAQTIEDAILAEHRSPLPRPLALELARAPWLVGCLDTEACQAQLARACEAEYALRVQVAPIVEAPSQPPSSRVPSSPAQPRRWRVAAQLVDAEVGRVAATAERTLVAADPAPAAAPAGQANAPAAATKPATTPAAPVAPAAEVESAAAILAEMIPALLNQASGRPRSTLEIMTEPAGAEVHLDGRKLGETPLRTASFSGAFALSVTRTGFEPERRELTVEDNQPVRLALKLRPAAEPAPPLLNLPWSELEQQPRPVWRLATGGALAAAGLVLTGLGGYAISLDGSCVSASTADVACTKLFDTAARGGALLGTGIVSLAVGVTLIALPGPRRWVPAWQPGGVPVTRPAQTP